MAAPGGLTPDGVGAASLYTSSLNLNVLAALARVEALGGRAIRDFVEPGDNLAVVADPDGNEFCLMKG